MMKKLLKGVFQMEVTQAAARCMSFKMCCEDGNPVGGPLYVCWLEVLLAFSA